MLSDDQLLAEALRLPYGRVKTLLDRFDLLEWAAKNVRLPTGGKLDFKTHPYQLALYRDRHPDIVCPKGAQLGFSTWAIAEALWVVSELSRNVIYTFPTGLDVTNFTAARINPTIRNSPQLSDRILSIDSVSLKQFSPYGRAERHTLEAAARNAEAVGKMDLAGSMRQKLAVGSIYFRGASGVEREAMSVDADALYHDELDRSHPRSIDQYKERLAAGSQGPEFRMGWMRRFSTPKLPGQLIDALWMVSDQHVWLVSCRKCGTEQELRFCGQPPEHGRDYCNVRPHADEWRKGDTEAGRAAFFVCHKCQNVLTDQDRLDGRWVSMQPGRQIRAYRVSQMAYVGRTAAQVLGKFVDAKWKADFWNLVMGIAFSESTDSLSEEMVMAATAAPFGGHEMLRACADPCFAGIDVGHRLHLVVDRPHPDAPGRWQRIWLEEAKEDVKDVEGCVRWLDNVMLRYNIRCLVIDALPEERLVEAFARKYRGRIYRSYYGGGKAGKRIVWDPEPPETKGTFVVNSDRTFVLDLARDRFSVGEVAMPRYNEMVQLFADHCKVTFRVPKYKQLEGADVQLVERYEWIETDEDHFRHADVYAMLATMRYDPLAAARGGTLTLQGAKAKLPLG